VGFIAVFSIVMFLCTKYVYPDKSDEEAIRILNSPGVQRIQGLISNFTRSNRRNRYGSVTIESFDIDSVHFQYEDALLGRFSSFSKTNNGVFRNGLPVRISYIKSDTEYDKSIWILKIEISSIE